jgi:hypothetical protein
MAKRGIRFDGTASIPENEFGDEAIIFGPKDELAYRRLLNEMKTNNDEEQ